MHECNTKTLKKGLQVFFSMQWAFVKKNKVSIILTPIILLAAWWVFFELIYLFGMAKLHFFEPSFNLKPFPWLFPIFDETASCIYDACHTTGRIMFEGIQPLVLTIFTPLILLSWVFIFMLAANDLCKLGHENKNTKEVAE